jgi:hypothetical protein
MRDVPDLTRIDLRELDSTARMAEALRRQGMALSVASATVPNC